MGNGRGSGRLLQASGCPVHVRGVPRPWEGPLPGIQPLPSLSRRSRLTPDQQQLLARAALSAAVPVPWARLQPAVHAALDAALDEFEAREGGAEAGPPPPMLSGLSLEGARAQLHALVSGMRAAPFTTQRLAELLLHPEKQYTRLPKLVSWVRGGGWGMEWVRARRPYLLRHTSGPPPPDKETRSWQGPAADAARRLGCWPQPQPTLRPGWAGPCRR